jgi:hypothetical protein
MPNSRGCNTLVQFDGKYTTFMILRNDVPCWTGTVVHKQLHISTWRCQAHLETLWKWSWSTMLFLCIVFQGGGFVFLKQCTSNDFPVRISICLLLPSLFTHTHEHCNPFFGTYLPLAGLAFQYQYSVSGNCRWSQSHLCCLCPMAYMLPVKMIVCHITGPLYYSEWQCFLQVALCILDLDALWIHRSLHLVQQNCQCAFCQLSSWLFHVRCCHQYETWCLCSLVPSQQDAFKLAERRFSSCLCFLMGHAALVSLFSNFPFLC